MQVENHQKNAPKKPDRKSPNLQMRTLKDQDEKPEKSRSKSPETAAREAKPTK